MRKTIKKVIVYSLLVGITQFGLNASILEASPRHEQQQNGWQQRNDRHWQQQRNDRDWNDRQWRENQQHERNVRHNRERR